MYPLTRSAHRLASTLYSVALLTFFGLSLTVRTTHAQVQEGRMNEILHADRTKTSDFADKKFASSASIGGKTATVRSFGFSHAATLRADDSFHTSAFDSGRDRFQTRGFATKSDRVARGDAFSGGNRGFATKALPVQDAPGSAKTANVARDYLPGQKASSIRGKRQDTIDEIRSQKDLSIDEVREILNKPNGRPGSRPDVGTLPVLRATPVTSPSAR